jgi:hypothetical protein
MNEFEQSQLVHKIRAERGNKSEGLGDTVKKITQKLGIKQCGGCQKRQASLNKLFPYKDKSIKET